MIKNAYINMRVNEKIKSESEFVLNELGLSLSGAIDLFLIQIIKERGIPFDVKLHSQEEESRKMKLVSVINSLGGVEINDDFKKIINLYAKGDIDYEVALYAIKRKFQR